MCKIADESQRPLNELIVLAMCEQGEPKEIVSAVYDASGDCPVCTLAALRQAGRTKPVCNESGLVLREPLPFDYRKACDEFWADVNAREYENDMRGFLG